MKLSKLILISMVFCANMLAQNSGYPESMEGSLTNIKTIKHTTVTYALGGGESQTIAESSGRAGYYAYYDDHNNYRTEQYVTVETFSFTLPSNAIFKELDIYVTSSYNGSVVEVPEDYDSYDSWSLMDTLLNAPSILGYPTNNATDVTEYAAPYISSGEVSFGLRSSYYPASVSIMCTIFYEIPAHISFQNNMGGQFSVNTVNHTGYYSEGYWLNTNISVATNEPQYTSNPNYTWIWNDTEAPDNKSSWDKLRNNVVVGQNYNSSFNFSVTVDDHNATYEAIMKKICNVTFQNSMNQGTMVVEGTARSLPYYTSIIENNLCSATATAKYWNLSGLDYTFSNWEDNSTSLSRTVVVPEHSSYIAYYASQPSTIGKAVTFGGTIGEPIVIYWNDNINPLITSYYIYRRARVNGVWTPEVLLGTVNPGVESFTDNDYLLAQWKQFQELVYDVREYSASTTINFSEPQWCTVYGMDYNIENNSSIAFDQQKEIPDEYSLGNYPNPFNPTTKINYQLPEKGNVILKVYDALGKEVRTLVNSPKEAGYYSVDFDASALPSGLYIYQIQAGKFSQSKKMMLVK